MKALLATVALATLLGTSSAWGQDCQYAWMAFENLTVAQEGADIVVRADIVENDARNPVEFYACRGDREDWDLSWVLNGTILDESNRASSFASDYPNAEPDCDSLALYRDGAVVMACPVAITPTSFEFRFPASALMPGNHFRYSFTFVEHLGSDGNCLISFEGKFDLQDKTPTRRVSLGGLKAAWR